MSWQIKDSVPYRLARSAKDRVTALVFERGLSDTGDRVSFEELGFENRDFRYYEASSWRWLRRALRGRRAGPEDVFIDFGCGKGRVVWQAAKRPFGRVIGVEISESLAEIARANLEANRHRLRCSDVSVVTTDATEFEIPDDLTYAYFFIPFAGETFRRVLGNIIASLDRRPRKLTLIYANPVSADVIAESGRFELLEVIKRPFRPDIGVTGWVYVYESRDARATEEVSDDGES